MKKLLIMGLALIGALTLAGTAFASPAETLQPASTITYSEEVVVNNILKANSVHIGSTEAGVGGVTYFNGSIVNAAVDEDGDSTIPITIADDLRVDGALYRGHTNSGSNDVDPIKVADSIYPTKDNTYSLGDSTYRFQNGYFSGDIETNSLVIREEAYVGGSAWREIVGSNRVDPHVTGGTEDDGSVDFLVDFGYVPMVTATVEYNGDDSTTAYTVYIKDITTSGFTYEVRKINNITVSDSTSGIEINWIAFGSI